MPLLSPRRTSHVRLGSLALVLALLSACAGSDDGTDPTTATPAGEEADDGAAPDDAGFPVTLEGAFGEATIEAPPERIVALGVTDADVVLALGTTPVAHGGYAFFERGLGPWADGLVDDGAETHVIRNDSEPDLDLLASLQPDLILAVSSGIEQDVYDLLSQIAPTVARPADTEPYQVDRARATELIATAMGQPERGRELNDDVDEALADVRDQHPEFAGATATAVLPFGDNYAAFTPGDARGQFLASLGFELPDAIAELVDDESFYVELSPEQVDRLDGDVLLGLVDADGADVTEGNALFDQLDVVRDGGVIDTTLDQRGAMTYNTVLSIPYALEVLVPDLAAAVAATGPSAGRD